MANQQAINAGVNVPSTNIWDVQQLYQVDVNSPEFKELLVRLYQNVNAIALALNVKDTGYYNTQEFVNGQLFFPNPQQTSVGQSGPQFRQVYRLVVNFGPLPDNATASVPHGLTITPGTTFTRIYGVSNDQIDMEYITIPYANPSIDVYVDQNNVNVTTFSDFSHYTITYIILEYIRF